MVPGVPDGHIGDDHSGSRDGYDLVQEFRRVERYSALVAVQDHVFPSAGLGTQGHVRPRELQGPPELINAGRREHGGSGGRVANRRGQLRGAGNLYGVYMGIDPLGAGLLGPAGDPGSAWKTKAVRESSGTLRGGIPDPESQCMIHHFLPFPPFKPASCPISPGAPRPTSAPPPGYASASPAAACPPPARRPRSRTD